MAVISSSMSFPCAAKGISACFSHYPISLGSIHFAKLAPKAVFQPCPAKLRGACSLTFLNALQQKSFQENLEQLSYPEL